MTNLTAASTRPRTSFTVLSHSGFRWFTLAGMCWMMADNIEHVISYWVIFEKFESPVLGGYAVISHWAPFLLGGVYMGALADRYDCRKLFLVSMSIFMCVSLGWATVFALDNVAIWHAIVFLTLHGIAGSIFSPASQLIIHDIVGNDDLPSAVRLTATSRQIGLLLGPAIGGGLLLALGPAAGIAVNALIYLPMIVWSLREPYTGHGDQAAHLRTRRPLSFGLSTAFSTVREVSSNRTIVTMIALVGITSLLVGNAYQAQMPEFAKEFVSSNDGLVYSALLVAGAAGAIFGGLVQETLPALSPTPTRAVVIATLWTASILVFAAAPNYFVAFLALFAAGGLLISYSSMAQALIQLSAPPAMRGRVLGVFNMSFNGLRIGSGVTVGFLGAVIGIHWSLGISAAVLIVALIPLLIYVKSGHEIAPVEAEASAH